MDPLGPALDASIRAAWPVIVLILKDNNEMTTDEPTCRTDLPVLASGVNLPKE